MRRASDTTAMQPRRPYESPIELRENSFPHPRVKSFLLVISIGSIAGCGYFLAHSPTFKQMFEPEFVPPIAATLPQPPKRSGQNPDTKSQNVKSLELGTPIAPSGAMTAAAAAVPSPHSVSKSADFSTPTAAGDTSAAVSYTSPDLAPAAHPVSYVAPPQGQVLGASTENASPQNFATVQQLADLQNQIDALKNLPRSVFVPSFSGPAASTPVSTATFALSQKIDQLSSTVTVGGSPIATAAMVSDSLSNYLPLSGGTLTGTTTLATSLGIGTTSPSSQLDLEDWTVTSPITWSGQNPVGGNPQLLAKGTLDGGSLTTGDIAGGLFSWDTAGSANNIDGLMLRLQPGYTGSRTVRVIDAQNLVAGASTLALQDIGGVIGVAAESQGTSTGDNVGIYSIAGFATGRNVAGFFRAYQDADTTPGTNIGVLSVAGHYGDNYLPTPIAPEIGGYFSIGTYYDPSRHIVRLNRRQRQHDCSPCVYWKSKWVRRLPDHWHRRPAQSAIHRLSEFLASEKPIRLDTLQY